MNNQYNFAWYPKTFDAWGTSLSERGEFRGDLFECMERADSECNDVTFKMEFKCGILSKILVLIREIESGVIYAK